jgi:hypothetical protein
LGGLPSTSLFKDDRLGGKAMHPDASDYSGSDDDGESIGSYSSRSSSGIDLPGDDSDSDDDGDRSNGYYSRGKRSRPFKRFKSNNYNGYYKHPFK